MRANVHALPRRERGRPHVIEKDEWPDRLERQARQTALHGEGADVARVRLEYGKEGARGIGHGAFLLRSWGTG